MKRYIVFSFALLLAALGDTSAQEQARGLKDKTVEARVGELMKTLKVTRSKARAFDLIVQYSNAKLAAIKADTALSLNDKQRRIRINAIETQQQLGRLLSPAERERLAAANKALVDKQRGRLEKSSQASLKKLAQPQSGATSADPQ